MEPEFLPAPPHEAPVPPPYVLVQPMGSDKAALMWPEVPEADGYLVLRATNIAELRPVAAAEDHTYIDHPLQAGITYYYAVRSYNQQGQSALCPAATVLLPQEATPQPEPQKPPESTFAGAPQHKRLRIKRDPALPQPPQSHVQAAPKPLAGLRAPLRPPSNLVALAYGTRQIRLRWQGEPEAHYQVFRSESPWENYSLITETADMAYVDAVPEAATQYYYYVQSCKAGQTSQASAMAEALTFPALPEPETPSNVRFSMLNPTTILLRWNGARGAAAYAVYARQDPGEEFAVVGHSLETNFAHENLPPETYMEYRVQAYHDSAASELSGVLSARTPAVRHAASPRANTPVAPASNAGFHAPGLRFPLF